MKETSPIHLDLFEVIKLAIASGEEEGGVDEDLEHVQVGKPEKKIPEKVVISKAAVEAKKGRARHPARTSISIGWHVTAGDCCVLIPVSESTVVTGICLLFLHYKDALLPQQIRSHKSRFIGRSSSKSG